MPNEAARELQPRPKQLYLDSSDYSMLSDPDVDQGWQLETLRILTTALDRNLIQIRSSATIVAEASPTSREATQHGVWRLRAIASLSRNKVVRFHGDLIQEELQGLFAEHKLRALSDSGDWLPRLEIDETLRSVKRRLLAQANAYPRKQRRAALSKDGKHLAITDRVELQQRIEEELSAKFPIVNSSGALIVGYLKGTQTLTQAVFAVFGGFQDLELYARTFESNFEQAENWGRWVRLSGDAHIDRVMTLRRKFQSHDSEVHGHIDDVFQRFILELANSREHFARSTTFTDESDLVTKAPTFFSAISAVMNVMRNTALKEKWPMKPRASDVGDMHHAANLPHVDMFRCDSAMRTHLTPIAAHFGTELYSDLDVLLARVDGWLGETH